MKFAILGILSLVFAAICSVFIFASATGIAGSSSASFGPTVVGSAAIGLVVGVVLEIYFFYRHYRGHPEMHLFDQDAR